jgi:alpha-L-arabinofuranosidase
MEAHPTKNKNWRPVVIKEGGPFADYFICHAYYPFGYPRNARYVATVKNMEKSKVEELYYKMVMAGAYQGLADWRWFRGQMQQGTPRAEEIRLCLTENGFHLDVHDPKAQNTVLVGVYDADLIGMMVEHAAELKLDNADLFYLQGDDPWVFLQHSFEKADASKITVRPPYYALYLWTHYFGDTLLSTDVTCGTFGIPLPEGDTWPKEGIFWTRIAAQEGIPLLAAHASLSADGQTLYLVVVNRDLYNDIESEIQLKGFPATGQADVHVLNTCVEAKSNKLEDMFAVWDSNNEDNPDTVTIRDSRVAVAGSVFKHKFAAHSATALVLRRK